MRKGTRRRFGSAPAALAALLLAASCGTTMPQTSQQGIDQDVTTGPGASAAVDTDGDGVISDDEIAAADEASARSQTSSAPRAVGGGPASQTPGASAPAATGATTSARGITDDTITIGFGTLDLAALTATFAPGASDNAQPTIEETVMAIIDWMNRHGGIAGREVKAIFHDFPMSDFANPATEPAREQAMCDDFTIDRPAFAAVPLITAGKVFHSCAAERSLVSIDIGNLGENVDADRYAQIGSVWYRPNWITGDRREHVVVEQLQRREFFKGAKLGLMLSDDPVSQRIAKRTLLPLLEKIGAKPVETFTYAWDDNGQAAVLRFKAAGVTHVMWGGCPCGGLTQSNFMNAAVSQQYKPLYALSTDLYIGAYRGIGAPAEQMANSVAFGWAPMFDGVTLDEGLNPTSSSCIEATEEANIAKQYTNYIYCEAIWLIKRGLEAAPELTTDGFRTGVEAMGEFEAASTYRALMAPNRHDGVSAVRDVHFEMECDCWKYRGELHAVG